MDQAKQPRFGQRKKPYFWIGACGFLAFSALALQQAPNPDPGRSLSYANLDWWLYPIETNAAKRLPAIDADLNAVAISSTGQIWVAGNGGLVIHSENSGRSWRRAGSDTVIEPSLSQFSIGVPTVQAAEPPKNPKADNPVQQSTIQQSPGSKDPYYSPPPAANQAEQKAFTPPAAPKEYASLPVEDYIGISMNAANDGSSVVMVQSRDANMYKTGDSGKTWSVVSFMEGRGVGPEDRQGLQFVFVGKKGQIKTSADGGKTWIQRTQGEQAEDLKSAAYRRSPAPWYYVTWLLWLLPIIPALVKLRERPSADPEAAKSIANVFVSDRPLRKGDVDAMDLGAVARGLARFLRNENTQAPLTIAINGEWGTGKSSLMNLLQAELVEAKFRPIWFNAWHHQSEDSLLAALLENVRLQAMPPWWSPEGIRLRFRIQVERGFRNLLPVLLALGVLAFCIGSFYSGSDVGFIAALSGVVGLLQGKDTGSAHTVGSVLTIVPSVLGVLYTLAKRLKAFAANPASLLVDSGGSVKELEDHAGFRQRFAIEFGEVTRAMGERSMIIFIDDLDRCRPDQVTQVLEAVNFLVSSGECYVILGIARPKVEKCVGLSFSQIAVEMAASGDTDAKDERSIRMLYARHYLDKLINIEVPLSAPTKDQALTMLTVEPRRQNDLTKANERLERFGKRLGLPLAAAIASLLFVFYTGQRFGNEVRTELTKQMKQPAPSSPSKPAAGPAQGNPPAPEVRAATIQPAYQSDWRSFDFSWFVLALPLAAFAWAFKLAVQAPPELQDSPEFTEAIALWAPVLNEALRTPRALKRFLNRVRFYSMRQPQDEKGQTKIPDCHLVALAAKQHCGDAANASLEKHEKRFGSLALSAEQKALFDQMSHGFQAN